MTTPSAPSTAARRTGMARRRTMAAVALACPLVLAPLAPAGAAVPVGYWDIAGTWGGGWAGYDPGTSTFGGYGQYDGGYGGLAGGQYGGGQYGAPYGGQYGGGQYGGSTTQDGSGQTNATTASTAASSGLVIVNTVLDYGQGEAAGTGLVIGSDGLVVTNHHVVQGATSITVTTSDGSTYRASVLGYDATHDVAVLRLAGVSGLTPVTTDSTRPTAGARVDAVGNAEGQGVLTDAVGTVVDDSTPIDVTEDDGTTAHLPDLIETSADVVPGDSGGALREADGDVVAMTVAASSGAANTTGYAIPIARVLRIADQIIAGDSSSSVTIGGKAALGIEVYGSSTQIAAVESSAAKEAGLVAGDTITAIDGTAITSPTALSAALAGHHPGDSVQVGFTDPSGQAESAQVTLTTGPIA